MKNIYSILPTLSGLRNHNKSNKGNSSPFHHFRFIPLLSALALTSMATYADEEETTDLDEMVIVQQQKLVESDGAKISYNVSEDPEAGSSNILDILRKVPGVSVDSEDNVKVNGQSSFKILMNGREDPMLKGDLKTVLKSIPASSIKKIEVISEPGAKYDAEGVGGILNIVTDRRRTLSGFMAQASTWVNAYSVGGSLNGRTKLRNVMLDAKVAYNNGRVWPRSTETWRETDYLGSKDGSRQTLYRKSKSLWDYTGVDLNMSWEPDTLNLFTLSANYGYNSFRSEGIEKREMTVPDATLWRLDRDKTSPGHYNGLGVAASFQHNFHRDDHSLVLSYEYDFSESKYAYIYKMLSSEGTISEHPYSENNSDVDTHSHIVQLDYSNRLSTRHLFEAGAKANINANSSFNTISYGESESLAVIDAASTMKLTQIKDIYALYASYTGNFSKWGVKGGLRYEHTRLGMRYKIGEYPDFTTRLNDIVPNAALSYNITSGSSLRLAYQMRISRPSLNSVNPFVNTLTPGTLTYGNPDLKSEKGHTFSLGYTNYDHPFTGGAKISYRYVSNGVNDVIFLRDGLVNYTYANIGRYHNVMLDLNFDWNIIQNLKWSFYSSTSYSDMRAASEMLKAKNHGWQTYLYTNMSYRLPSKWRLSAYGGYYTPWIDLQGRGTTDGYYYGLGASRAWLKDDALTLNLSAGNFLPPKKTNSYKQEDETVLLRTSTRYNQWNVGVSLTFKFGGLTASVKKTSANIEKESNSSGSGNKGGN